MLIEVEIEPSEVLEGLDAEEIIEHLKDNYSAISLVKDFDWSREEWMDALSEAGYDMHNIEGFIELNSHARGVSLGYLLKELTAEEKKNLLWELLKD